MLMCVCARMYVYILYFVPHLNAIARRARGHCHGHSHGFYDTKRVYEGWSRVWAFKSTIADQLQCNNFDKIDNLE